MGEKQSERFFTAVFSNDLKGLIPNAIFMMHNPIFFRCNKQDFRSSAVVYQAATATNKRQFV